MGPAALPEGSAMLATGQRERGDPGPLGFLPFKQHSPVRIDWEFSISGVERVAGKARGVGGANAPQKAGSKIENRIWAPERGSACQRHGNPHSVRTTKKKLNRLTNSS